MVQSQAAPLRLVASPVLGCKGCVSNIAWADPSWQPPAGLNKRKATEGGQVVNRRGKRTPLERKPPIVYQRGFPDAVAT
jgi:hypothetical protein